MAKPFGFPASTSFSLLLAALFFSLAAVSHQQPALDPAEQDAVYEILSSINPAIPWRTLFPDDLCLSAPHGVVCDYYTSEQEPDASQNVSGPSAPPPETAHIGQLSFGFVSDSSPNPPCSLNSTLNPLLFRSFQYLRKLFFYKCFTQTAVSVPNISSLSFGASLEELVFIENPSLVGPLSGIIGNFSNLRRLVLTGNGIYGNIPDGFGDLVNLEELTLSRNQLSGGVPLNSLGNLKKLRVLDLSQNHLDGNVPESLGYLSQLLKLDLSSNGFSGKIPGSLVGLQSLEFLDMSFNRFGNHGVPLFLGEMPRLREVYLSGNFLGGQIPEIWEKLGGISGLGFSNMGLVGNIPASIGKYLKNLCYLGLDNNRLEGKVPGELGSLEFANEINLENNNLSGGVPFSVNFTGQKLKLKGNSGLCVDEFGKNEGSFGQLKLCHKSAITSTVLFNGGSVSSSSSSSVRLSFCSSLIIGFVFVFAFTLMV